MTSPSKPPGRFDAAAAWISRSVDNLLRRVARRAPGKWARAAGERTLPVRRRIAGRYPPAVVTAAVLAFVALGLTGGLFAVRHEALRPVPVGDPAAGPAARPGAAPAARQAHGGRPQPAGPAGKPRARTPLNSLRPDKQQLFQRSLDDAASGSARRKPNYQQGRAQELARNRGPAAPAARSAGINDAMREGPFPAAQFAVHNLYQGPVGDSWYLVYAGAGRSDGTGPATGGVRVLAQSPAGVITTKGTFLAPAGTTPLRAVAVSGTVLTLAGRGGQRLSFDLSTLAYR